MNEEEYTKVLNVIDQVLGQVEEQLKEQPEGIIFLFFYWYSFNDQKIFLLFLQGPVKIQGG